MRRHVIIFVAAALCSHSGCSLQQMEDTATTDEPMARVASAIKGGSVPWGGMWSIWSPTPDMKVHPYVKGDFIISTWKNIEPSPNRFSFSALDGRIKAAVDKGLWVGIKIYQGNLCPSWIYSKGVPKVKTSRGAEYPYYFAPAYRPLLLRMIRRVARHLREEIPAKHSKRIVFVQGPVGSSGDPQPYHGDPINGYGINPSGSEWREWTRGIIKEYYGAYAGSGIKNVFNYGADSSRVSDFQWLMANAPGSMVKQSRFAHRYHLNDEARRLEFYKKNHHPVGTRNRGELDQERKENFQRHYAWNIYWMALWNLHAFLDSWNVRLNKPEWYKGYKDPVMHQAFNFFNRYAGHRDPARSPGGFVALRDGLDAADMQRFPQKTYGPFAVSKWGTVAPTQAHHDRMTKIAKAYAPYGAKQEDPANQLRLQVDWWLKSKGINDVGYSIHRGNYELFMRQIDANATSQGYFRQGSDKEPYGRFARGFNHKKGLDALYFEVDSRLVQRGADITVRVVYLDKGHGKWQLNVFTPRKQTFAVAKRGSGKWKEALFTVRGVSFGRSGPRGADITLTDTDQSDDIFHMVELSKKGTTSPIPDTGPIPPADAGAGDSTNDHETDASTGARADSAGQSADGGGIRIARDDMGIPVEDSGLGGQADLCNCRVSDRQSHARSG